MQVVTQEFVKNKKVLLRYDIDVALKQGERGKGKVKSQKILNSGQDYPR